MGIITMATLPSLEGMNGGAMLGVLSTCRSTLSMAPRVWSTPAMSVRVRARWSLRVTMARRGGVGGGGVVVDDLLYAGGFGGGWEGVGGCSAILSGGEAEEDAEGGGKGNDDGDPSCDDAFIHISTVRGG